MIGVLTVAPWHNSLGDIASSEATVTHLVDAGFTARPVICPRDGDSAHLVIGGGDLLGGTSRWRAIKRRFEVPGPHVLNAVGVDPASIDDIDWAFTADYRLVTVRDNDTAAALRSGYRSSARCRARPLSSNHSPGRSSSLSPATRALRDLESGAYVLVHRHPQLRRAARRLGRDAGLPLVVVDVQAHAQHASVAPDSSWRLRTHRGSW